ncbi:hypothetical protein BEH94_11570 [Candidatus Altiarchaeales archaeon WOR_SM1_SCG]|nr:hypothetical protein BEH94_11570 [Candidatus Altiarchaeales archaeon WOR_SM1_SCG]
MNKKNKPGHKQIIQRIVEKIKNNYNPEKIILFGSYAWGNPTKDSDIDLFIVKDTDEKPGDRQISVREILDEENALFALEPLIYTPEETEKRLKLGDGFIKKIFDKGVVVYG